MTSSKMMTSMKSTTTTSGSKMTTTSTRSMTVTSAKKITKGKSRYRTTGWPVITNIITLLMMMTCSSLSFAQ